jgi:putative transposase
MVKKNIPGSVEVKRAMIDPDHAEISIRRQCELLGLNRATFYYQAASETPENLGLMALIDKQYTQTPFYGWPRMTAFLRREGYAVNHKRVQRLIGLMGLQAIYPKPRTSSPARDHKIYPYLLRGLVITHPDQVWSSDITYLPLPGGFMYLVAIMDWYSRYVLAWRLSNTLDTLFCIAALQEALHGRQPEIFNTDQGCQFTSVAFTGLLETAGIRISMDGRGRALDNIFVERLWRTVKYEDVYLNKYATVPELIDGLTRFFIFYNDERLHSRLDYRTPAEVYYQTPAQTYFCS